MSHTITAAEAAPIVAALNQSTGLDWSFVGNRHFAARFELDAWEPTIFVGRAARRVGGSRGVDGGGRSVNGNETEGW